MGYFNSGSCSELISHMESCSSSVNYNLLPCSSTELTLNQIMTSFIAIGISGLEPAIAPGPKLRGGEWEVR